MSEKTFTLIVVPDHHAEVKRYRIPRRYLLQVGGAALFLVGLLAAGLIHYLAVAKDASDNRILREENLALKGQLQSIRQRVEHIGSTLDRVERFDQRLRTLTLRDGAVPAAEGAPGATASGVAGLPGAEGARPAGRLDRLSSEASRQEQSLQQLHAYFADQKSQLASTPSTWPVRGWVTSDFGQRLDPYTADRVMHAGLDIAGPHGKEVSSPSDGTVVFVGLEGGYGNVLVIDHGYGIKTRYGHLASIQVKPGERVRRGQWVATMGNTGRSTGPHLHYEVRVNGLPQNPRKFILDE